jgi:hypothetical protein
LTIIAVLLLSITFKLTNIAASLSASIQNRQAETASRQELINSNHRLERIFSDLIQQVQELNDAFVKKGRRERTDAK